VIVLKNQNTQNQHKITWKQIKKQKSLIFLTIPFVVYVIIFNYLPLGGWLMAFQNYKPRDGLWGSKFVGLDKFVQLFHNKLFIESIRNTFAIGALNLVFSTVFAIVFALMLNEVRIKGVKKFVQTVSYLPHFLSWIIVTGIVFDVLSLDNGIINQLLVGVGILDRPINWLAYPKFFWWIVTFATLWKETGWNSIIYLATMSSINPDLYEAAEIDGAGRFRKILHITLPGIKSTIFILLIINIGNILNTTFEIPYLLQNDLVRSVAQTIDIYVLKYGISQNDYSLGTAAGIFKSIVSIVIIFIANKIAKKMGEEHLF
jgi:putative aldouronate transport system permease protein